MKNNLRKVMLVFCLLLLLLYLSFPHTGQPSQASQLNQNPTISTFCDQTISPFAKELPLTLTNQGTSNYVYSAWPYLLERQKDGIWYTVDPAILHLPIEINEIAMLCPPGETTSVIIDLRPYGLFLPKGQYRIILDCYTTEAKQIDGLVYHSEDYLSCVFEVE